MQIILNWNWHPTPPFPFILLKHYGKQQIINCDCVTLGALFIWVPSLVTHCNTFSSTQMTFHRAKTQPSNHGEFSLQRNSQKARMRPKPFFFFFFMRLGVQPCFSWVLPWFQGHMAFVSPVFRSSPPNSDPWRDELTPVLSYSYLLCRMRDMISLGSLSFCATKSAGKHFFFFFSQQA